MSFSWKDRHGHYHALTNPEPISAEAEEIAGEIDGLIDMLEQADPTLRDKARAAIAPLQQRLLQLRADRTRWNHHAHQQNRAAAAEIVRGIDGLDTALSQVLLVVAVHGEHELIVSETAANPAQRSTILAGAPTRLQLDAIASCADVTPPRSGATRADAKAWLDLQPQFARRPHADSGWFAWVDRHDAAHRLADPLFIEVEVAAIFGELTAMRQELAGDLEEEPLFHAVGKASALMERLTNLQADLERFDHEQNARDLDECRQYAADWRSKRRSS